MERQIANIVSFTENQYSKQKNRFNEVKNKFPKSLLNLQPRISIIRNGRRISINAYNKEVEQLLGTLTKMPRKDKHIVTAEMKCFMSLPHHHDSHIIDDRIAGNAINKVKSNDRFLEKYQFSYGPFIELANNIINKCSDSRILLSSFQQCLQQNYPPTVQLMLKYLGIFLYSINSQYEIAEKYCAKLFDVIVRFKTEQYFIIYLLMKVKLKTNLSEWESSIKLLSKLLIFAWMYNLVNLQIWCYFEFSRAYFFLQMSFESEIFRRKSQSNSIESKKSIYREVCVSNLIYEINSIWEGQLDFNYDISVEYSRLTIPEADKFGVDQYISDQRKLKTTVKSITQECKIRHVGNLLIRIGEIGQHRLNKENQKPGSETVWKSGNNFLLTHQSFNKNMNMFFRTRRKNEAVFYTIENSHKNWGSLKEMLKNIFLEMALYCEIKL